MGSGTTPTENYPFIITYPRGNPIIDLSDIPDLLSFARALNDALRYAHDQHVYHCDVAPKNIVLHQKKPILIDWALSITNEVGLIVGFRGTATFASINVTRHWKESLERPYVYLGCDDFESLFYTVLYFACDKWLPWTGKENKENLADLKFDAMITHWSNTFSVVPLQFASLLDGMHRKLFKDPNSKNINSLFDE